MENEIQETSTSTLKEKILKIVNLILAFFGYSKDEDEDDKLSRLEEIVILNYEDQVSSTEEMSEVMSSQDEMLINIVESITDISIETIDEDMVEDYESDTDEQIIIDYESEEQ